MIVTALQQGIYLPISILIFEPTISSSTMSPSWMPNAEAIELGIAILREFPTRTTLSLCPISMASRRVIHKYRAYR